MYLVIFDVCSGVAGRSAVGYTPCWALHTRAWTLSRPLRKTLDFIYLKTACGSMYSVSRFWVLFSFCPVTSHVNDICKQSHFSCDEHYKKEPFFKRKLSVIDTRMHTLPEQKPNPPRLLSSLHIHLWYLCPWHSWLFHSWQLWQAWVTLIVEAFSLPAVACCYYTTIEWLETA